MTDMTPDAVARLEHEAEALAQLGNADGLLLAARLALKERDSEHSHHAPLVESLSLMLGLVADVVEQSAHDHARMIGWQVATYEIAPFAKAPEHSEPIAWLTGNAMMPPLRNLDALEAIWQADRDGDLFETAVDALEARLAELDVLMSMPDDDNALYVVDLERWEYVPEEEREADDDSLSAEWRRRS